MLRARFLTVVGHANMKQGRPVSCGIGLELEVSVRTGFTLMYVCMYLLVLSTERTQNQCILGTMSPPSAQLLASK